VFCDEPLKRRAVDVAVLDQISQLEIDDFGRRLRHSD
jgi:hypothetical protein